MLRFLIKLLTLGLLIFLLPSCTRKDLSFMVDGEIENLAWSPDGVRLAASSWSGANGIVDLWDIRSNERTQSRIISESKATSLGWSSFGSMISVATPARIVLWDPDTDVDHILEVDWGDILTTSWSPDGRWIASALTSGDVVLYSPHTRKPVQTLRTPLGYTVITWSPDSRRLAAGSEDGSVVVWDIH